MLYKVNAQIMEVMRPVHVAARHTRQMFYQPWNPLNTSWMFRTIRASMELTERLTDYYEEPAWDLDYTEIDGRQVAISYDVAMHKPYCDLLHFRRRTRGLKQPKLLILAPLSGHFATLLRGTVREFMYDHEVYITEWRNAREVPITEGSFSFNDYVDYLIDFMGWLGPDTHVLAVCQPCVPALVAAGYMAMHDNPNLPKA